MLTLSLLLLGLFSGQPQESNQTEQDEGFTIGVAVNQVFLSVNARSTTGGFVSGLPRTPTDDNTRGGTPPQWSCGHWAWQLLCGPFLHT